MKRRPRTAVTVLLALSVLICMTFAGASAVYAGGGGTPFVMDRSHDMWVEPGEDAYVFIELSEPVSAAAVEYVGDDNSWHLYKECNCPEEDGIRWEITVKEEFFEQYGYADLRFRYEWNGSSCYSEEFSVYWDDYRGYYRIAGQNRYDTALLIAWEKAVCSGEPGNPRKYPDVIVACGTDFADALGASYLSSWLGAPILLVNKSPGVIDKVADHITENLSPGGGVYILGGTGAVPASFEDALKARGMKDDDIKRFAGKNRYDTNLQILSYCGVFSQELLICCGTNFADALSASALGRPILLAGKTLTDDQKEFLKGLDPYYVDIIGGTGAVSESVESYIGSLGFDYTRIAGANRYETSLKVAEHFFLDHQHYHFALAYARNFPDGLAGGALAYDREAPLLLVDDKHYEYARTFVQEDDSRFATVFGGEALIPEETVRKILDLEL
ncbi:MAG: cell wall-binding repeat-containing protein [Clostridia bacterium]|nr:cell wall-binding repeat-containing protein [Clostridia bacterium]